MTPTRSSMPPVPAAPSSGIARCAVTGAGGFIGSRLMQRWRTQGRRDDVALVRRAASAQPMRDAGQRVALADLLQPATLGPALQGCDAVVHLAHGDDGPRATRHLLEALPRAGIRRLVHVSTMAVHGPAPGPEAAVEQTAVISRYGNDYCDSKAEQEELVQAAQRRGDIDCTILRPTIVYGPGSAFVSLVLDEARAGQVHLVDDGEGLCNAVYVDDVCAAVDAALQRPMTGEACFINGDDVVTWRRFIEAFVAGSGASPGYVALSAREALAWWQRQPSAVPPGLPRRVLNKLRRLAGWRPPPPAYPPLGRIQRETLTVAFRNDKAKSLLGWAPRVGFDEGVRLTLAELAVPR